MADPRTERNALLGATLVKKLQARAFDAYYCATKEEALQQALALIPEKERTAIVLHYFEDMPAKDIAAVMRAPIGTVLYWLSSGRKHLKQHIRL